MEDLDEDFYLFLTLVDMLILKLTLSSSPGRREKGAHLVD